MCGEARVYVYERVRESALCVLRAHSATGSSCITAAGKGSSHPDRLLLIPRLCCLTSV